MVVHGLNDGSSSTVTFPAVPAGATATAAAAGRGAAGRAARAGRAGRGGVGGGGTARLLEVIVSFDDQVTTIVRQTFTSFFGR